MSTGIPSPDELMEAARAADRAGGLRRGLVPGGPRAAGVGLRARGHAQRDRHDGAAVPDHQPPGPAPAGRGLVPASPRDRRRAGRVAAHRPGPAPDRVHRAVVPAGRGSRRPDPAQVGGGQPLPAALHGPRRGPPPRPGHRRRGGPGRDGAPPGRPGSVDAHRARGVPGPHGADVPGPLLPGLRRGPVVFGLAPGRRPHHDLSVREAGAEAPPVGGAGEAVATEVPVPPPLARRPGPGVPRRPLRHDPPGPGRGHGVGGRPLRRGRRSVQRGSVTDLPGAAQRGPLDGGHGAPARLPVRRERRPLLRSRLPRGASGPDRRRAPSLRLAR